MEASTGVELLNTSKEKSNGKVCVHVSSSVSDSCD